MVACAISLPLCLAAAIVDGVECVAPLSAVDSCSSTYLDAYPRCDVRHAPARAVCACATSTGSGHDAYDCSYLTEVLPAALAIGGSGVGDTSCGSTTRHLVTWLQLSTIFSSISLLLVFLAAVLGVLSAFSHRSCFKAVVLARHEESSFDFEGESESSFAERLQGSVEFASVRGSTVKNAVFGKSKSRGAAPSGADLF